MPEKLTKDGWEEKIYRHLVDELGIGIVPLERRLWWESDNGGMALSSTGFVRFEQAGITFHKYDCEVEMWTAAMTIGLSRMPCPYYLYSKKEVKPPFYRFCLADEEYAMLFMFTDKDLALFAKGFK